jgi:uncharacterized protein (TIGR03435 family)
MRHLVRASSVLVLVLTLPSSRVPLAAQSSPASTGRESFEVASVKPNRLKDAPEAASLQPGGGVRLTGFRLRTLIQVAYGSIEIQTSDQIVGGPNWIALDRFDIVAKAEGDLVPDEEGRRPQRLIEMLKTLIEDRFNVRVHLAKREMPAFALQLARRDRKPGPQLRESRAECPRLVVRVTPDPDRWCGFRNVSGDLTGRYVTMPEVAAALSGYSVVGRPVQDRTGLTGRYDVRVEFTPALIQGPNPNAPPVPNPAAESGPGLITAVKEQLGLTLQPVKASVPVIVIDRAEQPTPD